MKLRKNKKGFTIVELVIVIAVIGVLAAVLIPTFINLNNKANKAADESLVKNLNTALAAQEQEPGDTKNNTLHDAVEDLKDYGYLLPNLVAKSDDDLLWNQKTNRFLLAKEAPEDGTKPVDYWRIQNDLTNSEGYSIYAGTGFSAKDVTVAVGFDAGYHTDITSVKYEHTTGTAQEVIIRTVGNMCDFTVNAANDTVYHYGYANESKVVAVAGRSYHENGTSHNLIVTAGNVVIEETGVVFNLSAATGSTATVSNNGGNVMESSVSSVTGSGAFEINSLAQLEAFRDATNSGETFEGKTINLNKDITLTKAWKPISNYARTSNTSEYWFKGTFDGKNHTITGLTNIGLQKTEINSGRNDTTIKDDEFTYGLFASVYDAIIKNIKLVKVNIGSIEGLDPDTVGGLVGYYKNASKHEKDGNVIANISNVSVSGTITGSDNIGGVFGRAVGQYFKVENATVETGSSISANRKVCGIGQSLAGTLELDTCKNHATVASKVSAGSEKNSAAGLSIVWNAASVTYKPRKVIMTNCSNDGTITTVNTASLAAPMAMDYGPKVSMESNGTWSFNESTKTWVKE